MQVSAAGTLRRSERRSVVGPRVSGRLRLALIMQGGRLAVPGLLLGALLGPVQTDAHAQVQFDTWTTENGLPQNSVNDIVQTRDGYLWLATFGGLVRFDGVRFTVFDRSVEGIGSTRIRVLHEHSDGTLWAATEDGMLIRYRGGEFTTYGKDEGIPQVQALTMDEDDRGALWVLWASEITGDSVMTSHDDAGVTTYRPRDLIPDVQKYDPYKAGLLWWTSDSTGLRCVRGGELQLCVPPALLRDQQVVSAVLDRLDNVWLLTSEREVLKISRDTSRRFDTTAIGTESRNHQVSFFEDRHGNVWWSRADGLFLFREHRFERVSNMVVLTFNQDREGTLWAGSTLGLHRLRRNVIQTAGVRDGLPADMAYSIFRASSGDVWIDAHRFGVDLRSEGPVTFHARSSRKPPALVGALYEDVAGRLWVGLSSGLSYLQDGRFVRDTKTDSYLNEFVWAVAQDATGAMWFATHNGLVRRDASGRSRRYTAADGLPHTRATALVRSRAGVIWVGLLQGVAKVEGETITKTLTEEDGLVGNWVRAFYEDADGILWIGTYDGGLYRLEDTKLTRYTTREGLHDNGVFQILEDDFGYFWMGSNRGISRVSRQELNDFAEGRISSVRTRVFGIRDGMTSLECNGGRQPAGLKTADGRLWFPTMGGVAIVDPRAVRTPAVPPSVIIEGATVQGAAADVRAEITVPHDATSFEIQYTAPSFINPERMRFRHRMLGLDDRWVESGNERAATYHRLPPGRYQFVVAAAHEDGDWGPESAPVALVVLAPFWRQPWFAGVVLSVLVAAVAVADRRRAARHGRERAMHAAFAQRLIATQEAERKRISTDLHDSLGQDLFVIRAHVKAARDPERVPAAEIGGALDAIEGVARKASDDLREITHALRPYYLDKVGLSAAIEAMVGAVGEVSEISLETEMEEIDHLLAADDQIHVYRIVQESVNNVIRHSRATRARVVVKSLGATLEVRVEDDGRGFRPKADTAPAADGGLGLMAIRERARVLGGDAVIRSAPDAGTTLIVSIPLHGNGHDG